MKNRMKARATTALLNLTIQLPVVLLTAYLTAHFTVRKAATEQEELEQEYVENLQEAVRNEAELNARSIRRWIPKLLPIAKDLEDFVNDKGLSPPVFELRADPVIDAPQADVELDVLFAPCGQ